MSDLYQPHSALDLLQRFEGNVEARRRYLHERFERIREFDMSALDEAPDGMASTGDPAFSRNWTLLETPCVSVPGLRGERGGPIGVQVIGRRGDDAATLALAAFVEATFKKA